MKNLYKYIIFLIIIAIGLYYIIINPAKTISNTAGIKVLLVYNPILKDKYQNIINAYKSVLEEEGVPFDFVTPSFLLTKKASEIIKQFPVIIFPDYIAQILPSDIQLWMMDYLQLGGNMLAMFDTGTKNTDSNYLNRTIFSDILGLNYIVYNSLENSGTAYTTGFLKFKDKNAMNFFQIPPGKTNDDHFMVGYSYGKLQYPFARVEIEKPLIKKEIYAYGIDDNDKETPVIILKKFNKGSLLYVNLPLGQLKSIGDDLLLRSILRSFLFKTAKIPHLINTPGGKAGLVINWHIDWFKDWNGISYMMENGFFKKNIEYSIHNTAGDSCDKPGDKKGFDAEGKGREFLDSIKEFGVIGSHGGWAHNWFCTNIERGVFKEEQIRKYVKINNESLQRIAGYPIIEYSAPNGVHPQPLMTEILEDLGIIAYYYTGDSGSAPNRTFFKGKMVSDKLIAFPILSYRSIASMEEMKLTGVTGAEFRTWLFDLYKFLRNNRTIRLIYSHSYDVPAFHPEILKEFIDHLDIESGKELIRVKPMSYFAKFLTRFLKTKYFFVKDGNKLKININNPDGLSDITVAVPREIYKTPQFKTGEISIDKDESYLYITIKEKLNEKTLVLNIK